MRDTRISAIAVLICAIMASASWWYNRELSQGAISLTDVKIDYETKEKNKLYIKFRFILKNTGRETVKVSKISVGRIDVDTKKFDEVGRKPVMNPMHGQSIFTYHAALKRDIDPAISNSNKEISKFLRENVGKQVLILKLEYRSTSFFSPKQIVTKYFLAYNPGVGYDQLTWDEYEEIESGVPICFRVDE